MSCSRFEDLLVKAMPLETCPWGRLCWQLHHWESR